MVLVFKQIPRDEEGKKFLYVLDYLDMKFTLSSHKVRGVKLFCGWKNDESPKYMVLDDFTKCYYSLSPRFNGTVKNEDRVAHQLKMDMQTIANYIQHLYGFDTVEYRVEELMNTLIEDWLMET